MKLQSSANSFVFSGGGDIRLYAGKNWQLRPEVKVTRYTGDPATAAVYFTVGVFVQTKK